MLEYIVQLITIIFITVVAFLFLHTFPIGSSKPIVRDHDGFFHQSDWLITFQTDSNFGALILFGLLILGFAILALTHFDPCSFMHYWLPEEFPDLPQRCL